MIREIPAGEWDGLLNSRGLGDVYLRSGYLAASSILDDGEARFLLLEAPGGGVVFPLLLRTIPDEPTLSDVISPYGYGGPVGFGAAPPWQEFHARYDKWCKENRVVSSFVRFHPLYGNHRFASPSMQVEPLAGTVGWRIGAGTDLLAQMSARHRRSIRLALSKHVTFGQRPLDDEGFARFRDDYEETMRRVGASSFYQFPDSYWRALRALGRDLLLAETFNENGSVVASALLLSACPWIHYHLGASTLEGRPVRANVLMFFEVARAAQNAGYRVFHLGGGVGGSADSLLAFKTRFDAGGILKAAVGKQIHDMSAYRALSGLEGTTGYFPGYRKPA